MKLFANRVVLILHGTVTVATVVAVFIAGTSGNLPQRWQPALAFAASIAAALIAGTTAVLKFLDGSQKSEALQATRATYSSGTMLGAGTLDVSSAHNWPNESTAASYNPVSALSPQQPQGEPDPAVPAEQPQPAPPAPVQPAAPAPNPGGTA